MVFTDEQKAFCVKKYCSGEKSAKKVQLLFCKEYGIDSRSRTGIPSERSIRNWFQKMNVCGCLSVRHKRQGMTYTKSARSEENVEAVRRSAEVTPKKSVRRRSGELGVSKSSVHRILRQDLKMKAYQISVHQGLTANSMLARRTMCAWFLRQLEQAEDFLKSIWFSDEAHFYLNGNVNSRNYRHWATERPDEVIQRNLHVQKATAWVALSARGVIGPFWFCDENGATVTVTADRYISVLGQFWRSLGRFCGHERANQWLMQDGATPHTAKRVIKWLRDHFDERVISRLMDHPWAPHSPDLNPLDFFLWGHLKDKMSGEQFETLDELKNRVQQLARAVTTQQCEDTIHHFVYRLTSCLERGGGHFEHFFLNVKEMKFWLFFVY